MSNKTALITGASSGIGRELAKIHANGGGDLVIIARRAQKLEDLKKQLESKYKIKVMIVVKDLSQTNAPQEIFNEVNAMGVQVEYLINNAGFGGQGYFHERAWEKDLAMINVNILALTNLTRLFLPEMVKRNSGRILNVSSTAAFMPGPLQAVYFASKAYVTSFSNALAVELNETNITVTTLMPGATDTGFAGTSGMDKTDLFKKMVTAESVARDAYTGMMRGQLDVISGISTMMINSLKMMPKKSLMKIIKRKQKVK